MEVFHYFWDRNVKPTPMHSITGVYVVRLSESVVFFLLIICQRTDLLLQENIFANIPLAQTFTVFTKLVALKI